MQKNKSRIFGAFFLSWVVGIGYLFIALQFSPPRWSVAAMRGALLAAAESSLVYVVPPLLILSLAAFRRPAMSLLGVGAAAFTWVVLTVAWWASSFSPIPWGGALRNLLVLLPGSLVPSLAFYFLLANDKQRLH